jgi:hypothetical protein
MENIRDAVPPRSHPYCCDEIAKMANAGGPAFWPKRTGWADGTEPRRIVLNVQRFYSEFAGTIAPDVDVAGIRRATEVQHRAERAVSPQRHAGRRALVGLGVRAEARLARGRITSWRTLRSP